MGISLHFEDFYRLVRGACCQSPAIIVEASIVLYTGAKRRVSEVENGKQIHGTNHFGMLFPNVALRTIISSWPEFAITWAFNKATID